MRVFLTVLFLVPNLVFAEGETLTLLDCNTPDGPDAQVTVKENNGQYTLIELTPQGRQTSRDLSKEEWDSRKLKLQDDNYGSAELYQVQDGWFLNVVGPFYKSSGYADCWETENRGG